MRTFFHLAILSVILLPVFTGCNNSESSNAILTLVAERDSLRSANEMQRQRLDKINSMITTINSAMDSISAEEGQLFANVESELPMSKNDAIKSLERYEQVLKNQKQKINDIQLNVNNFDVGTDMTGMLALMQQQLDLKDRQITQLKSELAKKDVDISRLRKQVQSQRTQIENQTQTIVHLDNTTKMQNEALVRQDEFINSAYVIVGSKKDLERKGIIKHKRLIPESALDKSKFARIDIRKYREVTFTAKKPKILTDMPSRSYTLTTDGNGNFTLKINNPAEFWEISNYLVIQTN